MRELQARLQQLGWFSFRVGGHFGPSTARAVRGFQGKRRLPVTGEVDRATWRRLLAMTRTPTAAERQAKSTPVADTSGRTTAELDRRCRTGRVLCVSKRTRSLVWVVDGRRQLQVDVRFGSSRLPTRNGSFTVARKSRHHVSTIYHTAMPYAMFFSRGQAVHYSRDFAARGYRGASHGCVNVRDRKAIARLFAAVRVGDRVVVHT